MINLPHGPELLHVARRTLLDELLPLLPPEKVYETRMIANAMAIAARELAQRDAAEQESTKRIRVFLQSIAADPHRAATEETLAALIKERRIGPAAQEPLHELLTDLTTAKLAISNPKYLSGNQG
ncbi:DUF6285 domain-containing protein [Paralcaligenes ginsengisoli]